MCVNQLMRDPLTVCEACMWSTSYKCLPATLLFYLLWMQASQPE